MSLNRRPQWLPVQRSGGPGTRGLLTAVECKALPFKTKRVFAISDCDGKEIRGNHAHRTCEQFFVVVRGSLLLRYFGGDDQLTVSAAVVLDTTTKGLHVPPLHWVILPDVKPDVVVLVFCSHPYDDGDYIRDWQEFCELTERRQ